MIWKAINELLILTKRNLILNILKYILLIAIVITFLKVQMSWAILDHEYSWNVLNNFFLREEERRKEKKGRMEGGEGGRNRLSETALQWVIILSIPLGQMISSLWVLAPPSKARTSCYRERSAGCWQRVIVLFFNFPGPSNGEKLSLLRRTTNLLAMREI